MPWLGFFSASPALTDFRFSLKLMLCWYQCWCSCWPPWSPSCSHLYWEFVFVLIMKASLIFYLTFSSFSFSVLLCVQNIIAEKILPFSIYFFEKFLRKYQWYWWIDKSHTWWWKCFDWTFLISYFLGLCCDQTVFQLFSAVLKRFCPEHSKNVFLLVLAHLEPELELFEVDDIGDDGDYDL